MTRGLWLGSRTGTDHSQAPIGKEWARRTELLRPNPVTGKREDGGHSGAPRISLHVGGPTGAPNVTLRVGGP